MRLGLTGISVGNPTVPYGLPNSWCWCLAIILAVVSAVQLVRSNSYFIGSIRRNSAHHFLSLSLPLLDLEGDWFQND